MTTRTSIVVGLVVLALVTATVTTASAASRVLDSYCSPSGDYCTYVTKKDSGKILFQIRAFANYFGRSQACVTKDSRVCQGRSPHRQHDLYVWSISWQGNYPNQGTGRYRVRWIDSRGNQVGHALSFQQADPGVR